MALITTRKMIEVDVKPVAELSAQLGYPVSEMELKNRFVRIAATSGNGIFVALDDEQTEIGWMHVHTIDRLEVGRYAEIGGIVVDETMRGHGVGRALMLCAETWAREHGYDRVKLSSGAQRVEAHAFYEHIGYSNIRMSFRFEKILRA
jgi:GNAT superfamily N-acetyltransferase